LLAVPTRAWFLAPLFALAIVFVGACGGDEASDEAAPEEIHPCIDTSTDVFGLQPSRLRDPSAPVPALPAATPSPVDSSGFGSGIPGCDGPDFSQRCALWASQEYDHGTGQDIGCGRTMAQCGCALTSAASLLLRYGVTRGPDGRPTTPASLNDWFKAEARQTASGAVSRGYVYGGVNWLAVAAYSKQAAARFGTPELTFAGSINNDLAALQREVESGRPVVVQQPGHFVLAHGAASGTVAISDPFYPERTALNTPTYGNRFLSGRLYRPGPNVSALMVAAPRGVRFSVRDSSGAATGLRQSASEPVSEVRSSTFARDQAWRDPTCTLAAPKPDSGVDQAILSTPGAGKYKAEVSGNPNERYSVAVYAYDEAGGLTLKAFDGLIPASGSVTVDIDYDPAAGSMQRIELEGAPVGPPGAGSPTAAPAIRPSATATPLPATATTAPQPVVTRTPTRTPTRTATPVPNTTTLALSIAPPTAFCSDVENFALVTAVVRGADQNPMPGVAVQFSASAGEVIPSSGVTTEKGTASARLYPGVRAGGTQIQVTARLASDPSVSVEATFTCRIVFVVPTFEVAPVN
jgi:hypothetical protein